MYLHQLSHEARLIVQGRQEILRDAAALWSRFRALFRAAPAGQQPVPDRDRFAGLSFDDQEPDLRKEQG